MESTDNQIKFNQQQVGESGTGLPVFVVAPALALGALDRHRQVQAIIRDESHSDKIRVTVG